MSFEFTAENKEKVKAIIAKYPPGKQASAVMPLLDLAQRQNKGWLPREAMDHVAEVLGMARMRVYEVASFYEMYNLQPVGKYKLTLCTNLPCALQGATVAAEHLKKRLGIEFGETTAEGAYTLKEAECMGACGDAPVLLVNNKRMACAMTPDKLDQLLEELK